MSFQESNKASVFCWQHVIGSAVRGVFVETAQVYPGAPMVASYLKKNALRSVVDYADYAAEYRTAV